MSDCRFGVSPVNYPDPNPDISTEKQIEILLVFNNVFVYFNLLLLFLNKFLKHFAMVLV